MSHVTHTKRHVTHMNGSYHTCEPGMSHKVGGGLICDITHISFTHMSFTDMSFTDMSFTAHARVNHVTHMNESCQTFE